MSLSDTNTNNYQKVGESVNIHKLKAVFTAIYENEPCTVNLIANKCRMKPNEARASVHWLVENGLAVKYKGQDLPPKTKSQKFYSISSKLFSAVVIRNNDDTEIQLYSYKKKRMHPIEFRVPDRSLHVGDAYKKHCLSDLRAFFRNSFPSYKIIGVVFIDGNENEVSLKTMHVIDAVFCEEIPYTYTSLRSIIISEYLNKFSVNSILFADMTETHCNAYNSSTSPAYKRYKIKRLFANGKFNEKLFCEFTDRLMNEFDFEYCFIRVPVIFERNLRGLTEAISDGKHSFYVCPSVAIDELSLAAVSAFSPVLPASYSVNDLHQAKIAQHKEISGI